MLARDGIGSQQGIGIGIQAVARAGDDYSSCWSALPDGLRSQVESRLESSATAASERGSRRASAISSQPCPS